MSVFKDEGSIHQTGMDMDMKTVFLVLIIFLLVPNISSTTDATDAFVMGEIYESLNSPGQLTNWRPNAIDPCGENWKGISCSDSRVSEINLSSLGLSGIVAMQLQNLTSLTTLDISYNSLGNVVPFFLPSNLQRLNLAGCGYHGKFPYSISALTSLQYLNLSHNQLLGELTDIFGSFPALATLDLGFNLFTGLLPKSFSLLSNMDNMFLQDNQFAGTIGVLADLPLENLNVANNQFTGRIPSQLESINLELDGNLWDSVPSPPPPPPPATPDKAERGNQSCQPSGNGNSNSSVDGWNKFDHITMHIVEIVIAVVVCFCALREIMIRIYHKTAQNEPQVALQPV